MAVGAVNAAQNRCFSSGPNRGELVGMIQAIFKGNEGFDVWLV
jgi:hypothetical protein